MAFGYGRALVARALAPLPHGKGQCLFGVTEALGKRGRVHSCCILVDTLARGFGDQNGGIWLVARGFAVDLLSLSRALAWED